MAVCNGPNLEVTIFSGDAPFNITASAGINMPVLGIGPGTMIVFGPEKWDDVWIIETTGDGELLDLGQFKCRSNQRPIQISPPHQTRTTNAYPLFSWQSFPDANNYRVFLFDNKVISQRTVDIRENSDGALSMILSQPLNLGRYFWRVRARVNRVWSLWSTRWTLWVDPVDSVADPLPTIELNPTLVPLPTLMSVPTLAPQATETSVSTIAPPPPPNQR
jgi:hypothetical protein